MNGTVLFVDDEPSILKALERTFIDDELTVRTQRSAFFRSSRYTVVCTVV